MRDAHVCLAALQETSLKWMVNNFRGELRNGKWWPRNCILGDEVRGGGLQARCCAIVMPLMPAAHVMLLDMVEVAQC